jgi:hypothetical protein
MKLKQLAALALFAAALAVTPAVRKDLTVSCAFFCSQVDCIPEDVCGPFVNANGKTVCGCHPRP